MPWQARVAHIRHALTRLQAFHHCLRGLGFVVLVQCQQRFVQAVALQQRSGVAGVFASDGVGQCQHVQGAQTNVGQVANGGGHHVKCGGWIMRCGPAAACGLQRQLERKIQSVSIRKQGQPMPRRPAPNSGAMPLSCWRCSICNGRVGVCCSATSNAGRGGGEVDLIMRDADGTLVFVEVRQRSSAWLCQVRYSIGSTKQRPFGVCGPTLSGASAPVPAVPF